VNILQGIYEKGFEFINKINQMCNNTKQFLEKFPEGTDENYGYYPLERPLNKYLNYGIIVLDKPPGPTSHEVVAWIKKLLNIDKAGHGGTLEPYS
jgi:tRNA pseudouridine synthase B (EC 4.2.1.70)